MIRKDNKQVGFIYKATIPNEYQQVEYIESTPSTPTGMGLQYINTGYIPNSSEFKVNVIFTMPSDNYNSGCFVYGAYDSTNGYKPSLYVFVTTRKLGIYYNNTSNLNTNITAELDTEYNATITTSGANVTYDINGTTGTVTTAYSQLDNNTPITLFTSYVGNTYILRTRIKRFRVYDENDVLVRNMIPCYRKLDGVIGMYDKVGNTFYPSQGTGTMNKGNADTSIDKIYKGTDLVFEQGFDREQQGVPPIETTKATIGKDLKDYRIYGNSIQSDTPSLTTPIEVKSVGDKTKNMIKVPSVYTFTGYPNITSLIDKFEVGVTYELSWTKAIKGSTYQPSIFLGANVGFVNYLNATGGSKTFTYTSLPSDIYVYANGGNASQSKNVTSTIEGLMIRRVDTSEAGYEEYGYKIPVIAKSKNLLPYPYLNTTSNSLNFTCQKGKLKINGTASSTYWQIICTFTLPAGNYTFVEYNNLGAISGHSVQLGVDGTALINVTVESSRVNNFTLANDSTITLSLRFTSGVAINNEEIEMMVIKRGDSNNFERYLPPIKTNIYLNNPLLKIDDNADNADFKESKVIRKNAIYKVPSNYPVSNVTKYTNTILFSSMNVLTNGKYGVTNKMCNVLPVLNANENVEHLQGVNISATATWVYIYLNKTSIPDYSDELTDNELIAKLRTLLTSKDAKIYYQLATPTEETITLPNIPTLKGITTTFEIDTSVQPSNMYVKYKGR